MSPLSVARRSIRRVAVLLVVALVGCHVVAGIDESYRAVVPDDWQGPVAVVEQPNGCPEGTTAVRRLHAGLDAGAAACECAVPETACEVELQTWPVEAPLDCGSIQWAQLAIDLPPGTCVAVGIVDSFVAATTASSDVVPCENQAAAFDAPTWERDYDVCAVTDRASALIRACILREGDHPCPAGEFSEREVYHSGYQDLRECDCGTMVGKCGGTVGLVDSNDFSDPLEACTLGLVSQAVAFHTCAGPLDAAYAKLSGVSSAISCTVSSQDALVGEVVTEPVTVCCQP